MNLISLDVILIFMLCAFIFFMKGEKGSMDDLGLRPNETVIMKSENVGHGRMAPLTGNLILTDQNIIYVNMNVFGRTKGVLRYPLSQIKTYEGHASVRAGREALCLQLEVFIASGQETFTFNNKKDVLRWAKTVNDVISGMPIGSTMASDDENMVVPGFDVAGKMFGSVIRSTVDGFKSAIGAGASDAPSEQSSLSASRCTSCGAPISGVQGQIVRCRYCDTEQTLK